MIAPFKHLFRYALHGKDLSASPAANLSAIKISSAKVERRSSRSAWGRYSRDVLYEYMEYDECDVVPKATVDQDISPRIAHIVA